jgi:hypothetical protein
MKSTLSLSKLTQEVRSGNKAATEKIDRLV